MHFRSAIHLTCLYVCLATSGCWLDEDTSADEREPQELGIDDGANIGQETTTVVKSDGAAELVLPNGARVKVAHGAVAQEVTLGLKRPSDEEALRLLGSSYRIFELASAPYVVTPHRAQFAADVEVTLPVGQGLETQPLKVMWLEDESDLNWKELTRPRVENRQATFKVSHFSVLLLVVATAEPPTPKPSMVEATIGSAGGRLELTTDAGLAEVVIPPGALSAPTTLRFEWQVLTASLWRVEGLRGTSDVTGSTLAVTLAPMGTRFAVPVTLRIPSQAASDQLIRSDEDSGWMLAPRARLADRVASLETRVAGRFAAISTSAYGFSLEKATDLNPDCLLDRDYTSANACDFSTNCSWQRVGCTSAGSCTCVGGPLGQATFAGSCAQGGGPLLAAAADLCEWPSVAAYVPRDTLWEISAATDVSKCTPGFDLYVGSYDWFGPNGTEKSPWFHKSYLWERSAGLFGIFAEWRIISAPRGRVEVFEADCLRYRLHEAEVPCPRPVGFVTGTPTRITLNGASLADNFVTLYIQTNVQRGLPPDSFIESWSFDCSRAFPDPYTTTWDCSCTRKHVGAGPDHLSGKFIGEGWNAWDAARRLADGAGTAADAQMIADGCGWPSAEFLPVRKYVRPPSGTTLPGVMPVCLAP
jgi:hypothetical protein